MTDIQHELVHHCIDTGEFVTIKISNGYFLFHRNVITYSDLQQADFELPQAVMRQINGATMLSIKDAKIVPHVEHSRYEMIVFPDKSIVYTRKRKRSSGDNCGKKLKRLPYYVSEDLELLKSIGMAKEDIDLFVQKLDGIENMAFFHSDKADRIIQRIIAYTDIPTRLRCREVSRRWKGFVDGSRSWNSVKVSKLCRHFDRALNYFQNIDIRELDLSESSIDRSTLKFLNEPHLYSLRSLYISTDHPLELFTLLFKTAPFLQHIKLIQTFDSCSKLKNDNHQLYERINFVICQCQERLKCLRRLHIQLRSVSDQIFLESSSVTSVPVSYEVIQS